MEMQIIFNCSIACNMTRFHGEVLRLVDTPDQLPSSRGKGTRLIRLCTVVIKTYTLMIRDTQPCSRRWAKAPNKTYSPSNWFQKHSPQAGGQTIVCEYQPGDSDAYT